MTTRYSMMMRTVMVEIWKDIEGWPLHQISNMGHVRALPGAQIKSRTAQKIEIRKLTRMTLGYFQVGVPRRYVHDLVLIAFRGLRPTGADSRHLNGDPGDNRLDNLEWGSRAENEADKIVHGRSNQGERNGRAKLSASYVAAIRSAVGPRGLVAELARQYGVTHSTISMIRSSRRWAEPNNYDVRHEQLGGQDESNSGSQRQA